MGKDRRTEKRIACILRRLQGDGCLTRGLRAIIAHHTIFAWNRLGIPAPAQAAIAQASKEVILDEPAGLPA